MLQLRRLRSFNSAEGLREYDTCFEPDILIESHTELFANLDSHIAKIPKFERYNCHYTLGDTTGGKKRGSGTFLSQSLVPFDVDGIVFKSKEENKKFLDIFFEVTGLDPAKTVAVFSGHGLHLVVQVAKWTDKKYFKDHVHAYSALCTRIEDAYRAAGLEFKELDRAVFAPNKMLRLPGTQNRKVGKENVDAKLLQHVLEEQEISWPSVAKKRQSQKAGNKLKQNHETKESAGTEECNTQAKNYSVDNIGVHECPFLKHCAENQPSVSEGQWYAALSIWSRLPDGEAVCHENSRGHPKYTPEETSRKITQALETTGPRTCASIETLWGGCPACPHYGKVSSPISIKRAEFIATKDQGFYSIVGEDKKIPEYGDLVKHFEQTNPFVTHIDSSAVFVFNGKKYEHWKQNQLRAFAAENFRPEPKEYVLKEFGSWVTRRNLIASEFFECQDLINFENGVLDLRDMQFKPHSSDYGFLYMLPYEYRPEAKCPEFDSMMGRITCNDKELEELLLEFVGYAICDRSYWIHQAMILVGEGSNGKSTFLEVVKKLVGKANYTAVGLKEFENDNKRHMLNGKLVNLSDEMPNLGNRDTDTFKKMMGGDITAKKLYNDAAIMRCTTKLIFAANEIPSTFDHSHGLYRRLLLVPFNATFDKKNSDYSIMDKIEEELPGIFNRVFEAFKVLKKRRQFTEAKASVHELTRYRADNDIVGTFISDCITWTEGPWLETDFMPFSEIMTKLSNYCRSINEREASAKKLTTALRRVIPRLEERRARKWNNTDGKNELGYKGINFMRKETLPRIDTIEGLDRVNSNQMKLQ